MRKMPKGSICFYLIVSLNITGVRSHRTEPHSGVPSSSITMPIKAFKRKHRGFIGVCVTVAFGKKTEMKWEIV